MEIKNSVQNQNQQNQKNDEQQNEINNKLNKLQNLEFIDLDTIKKARQKQVITTFKEKKLKKNKNNNKEDSAKNFTKNESFQNFNNYQLMGSFNQITNNSSFYPLQQRIQHDFETVFGILCKQTGQRNQQDLEILEAYFENGNNEKFFDFLMKNLDFDKFFQKDSKKLGNYQINNNSNKQYQSKQQIQDKDDEDSDGKILEVEQDQYNENLSDFEDQDKIEDQNKKQIKYYQVLKGKIGQYFPVNIRENLSFQSQQNSMNYKNKKNKKVWTKEISQKHLDSPFYYKQKGDIIGETAFLSLKNSEKIIFEFEIREKENRLNKRSKSQGGQKRIKYNLGQSSFNQTQKNRNFSQVYQKTNLNSNFYNYNINSNSTANYHNPNQNLLKNQLQNQNQNYGYDSFLQLRGSQQRIYTAKIEDDDTVLIYLQDKFFKEKIENKLFFHDQNLIELFSNVQGFQQFPVWFFFQLAKFQEYVECEKNTVLYNVGDQAQYLYVLVNGIVQISGQNQENLKNNNKEKKDKEDQEDQKQKKRYEEQKNQQVLENQKEFGIQSDCEKNEIQQFQVEKDVLFKQGLSYFGDDGILSNELQSQQLIQNNNNNFDQFSENGNLNNEQRQLYFTQKQLDQKQIWLKQKEQEENQNQLQGNSQQMSHKNLQQLSKLKQQQNKKRIIRSVTSARKLKFQDDFQQQNKILSKKLENEQSQNEFLPSNILKDIKAQTITKEIVNYQLKLAQKKYPTNFQLKQQKEELLEQDFFNLSGNNYSNNNNSFFLKSKEKIRKLLMEKNDFETNSNYKNFNRLAGKIKPKSERKEKERLQKEILFQDSFQFNLGGNSSYGKKTFLKKNSDKYSQRFFKLVSESKKQDRSQTCFQEQKNQKLNTGLQFQNQQQLNSQYQLQIKNDYSKTQDDMNNKFKIFQQQILQAKIDENQNSQDKFDQDKNRDLKMKNKQENKHINLQEQQFLPKKNNGQILISNQNLTQDKNLGDKQYIQKNLTENQNQEQKSELNNAVYQKDSENDSNLDQKEENQKKKCGQKNKQNQNFSNNSSSFFILKSNQENLEEKQGQDFQSDQKNTQFKLDRDNKNQKIIQSNENKGKNKNNDFLQNQKILKEIDFLDQQLKNDKNQQVNQKLQQFQSSSKNINNLSQYKMKIYDIEQLLPEKFQKKEEDYGQNKKMISNFKEFEEQKKNWVQNYLEIQQKQQKIEKKNKGKLRSITTFNRVLCYQNQNQNQNQNSSQKKFVNQSGSKQNEEIKSGQKVQSSTQIDLNNSLDQELLFNYIRLKSNQQENQKNQDQQKNLQDFVDKNFDYKKCIYEDININFLDQFQQQQKQKNNQEYVKMKRYFNLNDREQPLGNELPLFASFRFLKKIEGKNEKDNNLYLKHVYAQKEIEDFTNFLTEKEKRQFFSQQKFNQNLLREENNIYKNQDNLNNLNKNQNQNFGNNRANFQGGKINNSKSNASKLSSQTLDFQFQQDKVAKSNLGLENLQFSQQQIQNSSKIQKQSKNQGKLEQGVRPGQVMEVKNRSISQQGQNRKILGTQQKQAIQEQFQKFLDQKKIQNLLIFRQGFGDDQNQYAKEKEKFNQFKLQFMNGLVKHENIS
ncbi:Cyclic nucleotide-binding protein [Pseudocohnilembus persalinus]|uniref:Cyclic nucleotide-binding protein n=1 Tax=Pseudocohnilembus persalinus TaxID=266149 RepID=A0A0V0QG48_PSEPJ|nr:Cyclic nucleotide-binding protein [Pseudocohnilembus persalinus]|eukprot:KRX01193.1 Cyclic nucleotide-binding protein [Pseudocohnilembus persalinus]